MPERSCRPRKPDPGKGHAHGDHEADAAEPGGRRLLGRQEAGPGPVRFRADQIALLRGAGEPKTWPRGWVFLSESDQGGSAFLIEQGQVKVTVSSRSGYTTLLAIRGPGELIGELSALDGQTRSGTATTLSDVQAIEIRADRFRALLERNGHLALAVLKSVVGRLRDSDRRRAEFGGQSTKLRVASVLVEMAERYGTTRPGAGAAKVIAVTQQELAGASGMSRESVVRSLRDLHGAGLVETGRGKVIVLDPASLAELVRG